MTEALNHKDYDLLLDLVKTRSSVRSLKSDPLPEGSVEKIIEAGHWAMSGANSQPWEFIVVRDRETKLAIQEAYKEVNIDYAYWMEQQRIPELRHPSFHLKGDPYEQIEHIKSRAKWADAPELIVVIGDGRRQWGTVMAGHTFGRDQSHLTDGLANCCQIMHLAAASLGLGTQWITIHIQEPYRRILNIPDIYTIYLIIPVGFPAVEAKKGVRRDIEDMIHYDMYDPDKFISNEGILDYLAGLRGKTLEKYRVSYGEGK
ncbi:nitroreductase family protein [Paenibacillus validus]|uniref:nitroreductase family protein n=1 Tax=Paenibacillus validus TaxID=44253 RepID=UPI000FDCA04E|nr:nitroreductase family protein [Paenibacillus validus]MED4600951.1 nitroreductase family protein [Paenibacillus validus]MED4606950.1 nitroreductase family protein [Paenibacillus validus]